MDKKLGLIVIMNYYKREKEAHYLKKVIETSARPLGIQVLISTDYGEMGIWGNLKRCLTMGENPGTHRLVVHDDVIFDRNVLEKVIHIMQFMPDDSFLGLYNPDNKEYKLARNLGNRILRATHNFWTQAILYDDREAARFINWCDQHIDPRFIWDDTRMKYYFEKNQKHLNVVVPSLFQHLGAYRSTFHMAGKIFGIKRYSATFDSSQDVNINWKQHFENPYISTSRFDVGNYLTKQQLKKDKR